MCPQWQSNSGYWNIETKRTSKKEVNGLHEYLHIYTIHIYLSSHSHAYLSMYVCMYMLSLGRACGNARNWYGGEHEYNCTNTDEIVMRYKFVWLCLCFGFALCQRKPLKSTTILIRWWHVATTHASSTTTDNDNDSFCSWGGEVKLLSLLEIITSHDLVCKQVPMLPELSVCSPKRIHMYIFIWPLSLKRFLDSNVGKATVLRLLLLLLLSFFPPFKLRQKKHRYAHTYICIYEYIFILHACIHIYMCMLVKCSCLVRCDALAAPNVKTNNKNKEIKLAFQYIGNNNEKQWQRSRSAAQLRLLRRRTGPEPSKNNE